MQLQSFAKDSEEEGSFGQCVGGNLCLPCCRHLALLALYRTVTEKKKKQCYDTIVCLKKMVLSALFLYMLLTVSIAAFADGLKEFLPHFTTHVSLFTFV